MTTDMQKETIHTLVVEDDDQDYLLLRRQLLHSERLGFSLVRAGTLAESLRLLEEQTFQIVLLDLSLPDSRGVETVHRLVEQAAGLPVVVLTGTSDEALGAEVIQQGAQDYLPKSDIGGALLSRSIAYAMERHRTLTAASHAALHDTLTGLANRALFQDRLENAMEGCERRGELLALAYFDLDGFKPINDGMGHHAGDQVLRQVAQRFREAVRKSDTVARLGGDEFACILPGVADPDAALTLVDKLRKRVSGHYRVTPDHRGANPEVQLGTSVGVAIFPRDGDKADDLLMEADRAMYRAKREGGKTVVMAASPEPVCRMAMTAPVRDTVLSVLVVDDDREDVRLTEQTLLASGEVQDPLLKADTLAGGIRLSRQETPDVVLLDLNLPDSRGLVTLRRFLDGAPPLPVVVLTSISDRDSALEALRCGAQDYLAKDWRYRELWVRALRHALERHGLLRRISHAEERERLANTDLLTGLANRRLFRGRLAQLADDAAVGGGRFALLFVDLRRFKVINDSFGHGVGDRVLSRVGEIFSTTVRGSDLVARIGGDEFAVVLPTVSGEADALRVAQNLVHEVSEPLEVEGHRLDVGATAGVAIGPDHAPDPDGLLRCADLAMFAARQSGDDCALYTPALGEAAELRLTLERDLRRGLERDELELHYQPIADPRSGTAVSAEALVRWRHPRLGLLPPGEFIPIAEDSGLIKALDDWVLKAVCRELTAHRERTGEALRVAVNISGRHFSDGTLAQRVGATLAQTGTDPAQVKLEVTETAMVRDARQAAATMHQLKAQGLTLALDDFGVEYSSLSYLRQFPVDVIKVDRTFVARLTENRRDCTIVEAVVGLAQRLGLTVVLEGIETPAQLTWCAGRSGVLAQGYLVGRPAPGLAAAFTRPAET